MLSVQELLALGPVPVRRWMRTTAEGAIYPRIHYDVRLRGFGVEGHNRFRPDAD
jgi:hypothetical protein